MANSSLERRRHDGGSYLVSHSFYSPLRILLSSFEANVPPHLLTYPCSLWFPSVTEICVWAASHEGLSLTQKMLGGPSTLGTWLLLPQVCLPSHDAMLGCQVFHLGNTWHFQPQGFSTDAISKIIFEKATNILNS